MNSQWMDIILALVVVEILATEKKRKLDIEMIGWSPNVTWTHQSYAITILWGATKEAVWKILRGTVKGQQQWMAQERKPLSLWSRCCHGRE